MGAVRRAYRRASTPKYLVQVEMPEALVAVLDMLSDRQGLTRSGWVRHVVAVAATAQAGGNIQELYERWKKGEMEEHENNSMSDIVGSEVEANA